MQVFDQGIYQSDDDIKEWDNDFFYQFDFMFLDDTYFDYEEESVTEMEQTGSRFSC